MNKVIFLFFIFLIPTAGIYSQQVWPVQVTGSIIPPHSLDLKVYGNDRSTDLNFQVLLNDPEELALQVIPILTIEQNGNVIYQTDMNYSANPITLNQFTSYLLDGAALNQYLSAEALSGNNGIGKGATLIPEGFTQICLQMYGVDRTVPVSNKFCVSGNFKLNQAPQLIKPSFNDIIKMPPVQNMIFSWMPMHLSSGNNPGAVEYVFELVELPIGVMNANDVFESALKIYSTTVMSTSFIYSQSEPVLNPNTYYAWRVTAKSILYPTSLLFQNEGKSEISMFMMYDGDAPSTELNPFDNPAPRGCSVYETSYGPIAKADNESMILGANQEVKLGYFKMKITEAIGDIQNGYSGKGIVYYPMLRSSLEVEFKNIRVNKEGRVYEAEWIESKSDRLALSNEQLKAENISQSVNGDYANDLYNLIDDSKKVSLLSENGAKLNALPLALTNEKFPNTLVCVIGARFTPTNAYLNLIGLDLDDNNNSTRNLNVSAATAIPSTPYGLMSNAYLVPLSGASQKTELSDIQTILIANAQDKSSKLNCDCEGITDKKLSKTYIISPELIIVPSTKTPLSLSLSDKNQAFETYNGSIGAIPDFVINGINNLSLSAEGGILNLNNESKLNLPVTIKNSISGEISKGVLMTGLKAKLSEKFNLLNAKEVVLENGNLLIDANTIKYAKISKENLIRLKDGIVDKWQFSVDEMNITINDGVIDGPRLTGQLKLPIASNTIPYSGSFDINANENPKLIINDKPKTLDVDMWKSKLELEDGSLITADIININNQNKILPKGNLSGELSMKMEGQEFLNSIKGSSAEVKANMKTLFDIEVEINSIEMKGLKIPNWNIDPYNSMNKKYQSGNIDYSKAKLLINGKEFSLTDATIKYELVDGKERIGLQFTTSNKNSKMTMTIWAKEENDKFEFDHIKQDMFILNCDCVEGKSFGLQNSSNRYNSDSKINSSDLQHQGSLASMNTDQNNSNLFKSGLIEAFADKEFVLKNNATLYWPLIDQDLAIHKNMNSIKLLKKIEIDEKVFSKMGFKSRYNIPIGAKLYISELEIAVWKESGAEAKIRFELESQYDPNDPKKLMTFKSEPLIALGNSVTIKDVDLILQNNFANGPWELKNYKWVAEKNYAQGDDRNLARIDCQSGFKYYNMNGWFNLDNMVHYSNKERTELSFRLNTGKLGNAHSLIDFIAIVQDYSFNSSSKWHVHIKDKPQVSFKAGDNYSVYFDNSSLLKIPTNFISKSYSKSTSDKAFKGLIMEKASIELLGFKDKNNNPLTMPITDVIYVISDIEGGLYSSFEKSDIFSKTSGAKISGWPYELKKVSYYIKGSNFENDLELEGAISIPIFKNVPDKIKSVQFDSSWVNYTGYVYTSTDNQKSSVNSYFEFDDVSLKTYQSDFIPGLGVVLNEDSNISMTYNNTSKSWDPSGTFSGLGIILLTSETMKAYGLTSFPSGMDLSLNCLTFEGMILNGENASASQKIIDDYGIKSLEFGTWGVVDYKSLFSIGSEKKEGDSNNSTTNNNKPEAKISTSSGKVVNSKNGNVKTVSTASSRIIRKKDGSIVNVSTASGSVKRTKKQVTTQSPATTAKADKEPEFNGLKFGVDCKGVVASGNNFELLVSATVSLLGESKEKKAGKEVKSCAISASGGVGLEFSKVNGKFKAEGVNFKCLAIEAAIGPVDIKGGLSILKTPTDQYGKPLLNNNHGSGFKAYLSATMMGLGGIQTVGQFGKKYINDTKSYYYGFIDLEAFKQSGFAIPPPTPSNTPVIDLYGGGGGLRINMKSKSTLSDLKLKKDSETAPANECPIPDAKYLNPGVGFSQEYEPEKGTYGANFYVILGPWNELDNQNPPIYSIIAEPGLDIEIFTDTISGDLQFGKIKANVNAYFKPTSLASRRSENIADAFASLEFNLRERAIVGEFGMRAKVEVPGFKSALLQLPEDYSKTKFETKANYAKGTMLFSFDNRNGKKPSFNFKFGGSSIDKFTSASGLSYNTALLSISEKVKVKSGMYFQIGNEVDEFPPLKTLIPQISDMESSQYEAVRTGEKENHRISGKKGISFGYRGTMEATPKVGPLSAKLDVGLGFNALLVETNNVSCSNTSNGTIGIKGWYAQGQAYGYANGNVNLEYNFFFASGRVNIFKGGAFVYLQAKAPNPSYFAGRVNGNYSVLDGLLAGSFNQKFELGAKCENLTLPSPLEGVTIFNQANIVNGNTNVDRYTDISVTTNIALQKEFNATQVDGNGNPLQNETFIADVKEVKLIQKSNSSEVKFYRNSRQDKLGFDVKLYDPLLPSTEYQFQYSFVWKKKVDGQFIENFESGKKGDEKKESKIEKGTIDFRTGVRSETIVPNMVEYMAPGDGQRYWLSGYANTELKFKLKALEDAVYLFPDNCESCTSFFKKQVKFKYYIKLKEFGQDGIVVSQKSIPITSYPSKSNMEKILKPKPVSVGGDRYIINVLSEENVPISSVSFPDLKSMTLTKGSMYELSVIRVPDIDSRQYALEQAKNNVNKKTNSESTLTVDKNNITNIVVEKEAENVIRDNTRILHTSYFAVSNYTSLYEKLQKLTVKHVKSTVKRRDFQHPNDAFDGQRSAAISKYGESKFHSVKDDYYAFTIDNNNTEGLDKYDILRIKRNLKLSYTDAYMPEERIKMDRYGGKGIYNLFDEVLKNNYFENISGYMRKVLYEYNKAETEGIAKYGNLNTSDGTKWGYAISGPIDERCNVLQADEIAAKKVLHKVSYKSNYDPNYSDPVFEREVEFDFLLQDYRSRIIINQMAWLSRLSAGLKTNNNDLNNWLPGNHPEGEFLSENKRFNNFDWVLYGDSGKNNKGNAYTYIASEPGYQFSYHGRTDISFPSTSRWNEMIESQRDKNTSMGTISSFSPNRTVGQLVEQTVTNPTDLVENYWYKIKSSGKTLSIGDKSQAWTSLFGVGQPYNNYSYKDGQYGLYSLGGGGWPTIREFRQIDNPMDHFENIWNFTSEPGNKMKLINERYKSRIEIAQNKIFPSVLDHSDFRWARNKRYPNPDANEGWLDENVEIVELAGLIFHPEKYYTISDGNTTLKDPNGSDKWKILQEGRFNRFQSSNGYILKIDYYEEYKFFSSNVDHYNLKTDDRNFPSDKYGNPNGYYRSVWSVVPASPGGKYYFIKNAKYQEYFLDENNGKFEATKSSVGDQVIISEVK